MDPADAYAVDKDDEADGTKDKSKLGAKILAVSIANARAAANAWSPAVPFPWRCVWKPSSVPMMNILNGGAHAAKHH